MVDLGSALVSQGEHLNRQFVTRTDIISTLRVATERMKILPDTTKVVEIIYDLDQTFILGHDTSGILGTSKLGSVIDSSNTANVININNTFKERFSHSDFNDTDITTATITTSTGTCQLEIGEVYQTKIIGKNNTAYTTMTLNTTGTNTSDLANSISLDAGSTWNSITIGTQANISNSSVAGIKLRLLNSSIVNPITLTEYDVTYN